MFWKTYNIQSCLLIKCFGKHVIYNHNRPSLLIKCFGKHHNTQVYWNRIIDKMFWKTCNIQSQSPKYYWNKMFWKTVKPHFSNKIKTEKNHLIGRLFLKTPKYY